MASPEQGQKKKENGFENALNPNYKFFARSIYFIIQLQFSSKFEVCWDQGASLSPTQLTAVFLPEILTWDFISAALP